VNKIKGRVICKIAEILSEMDTDNPDEGIKVIERILAIEEIAIGLDALESGYIGLPKEEKPFNPGAVAEL